MSEDDRLSWRRCTPDFLDAVLARLTERQREVIEALADCNGNIRRCANQLGVSYSFVHAVRARTRFIVGHLWLWMPLSANGEKAELGEFAILSRAV